jgi:acyl-CoA thioester hydrolase
MAMLSSLAVLESGVMFEARFQTYWEHMDAAGFIHVPHFWAFISRAESELYRTSGQGRESLMRENGVWMARVEAFARFVKPIRLGRAIRVRLSPQIRGLKTIRYDFVILDNQGVDDLAAGYVTVVCVDAVTFKSRPIPDPVRKVVEQHT